MGWDTCHGMVEAFKARYSKLRFEERKTSEPGLERLDVLNIRLRSYSVIVRFLAKSGFYAYLQEVFF